MTEIQKDKMVGVRQGSWVLRDGSKVPEQLASIDGGAVVEPPLTVLKGIIPLGASVATVRMVVAPGKVQGQTGLFVVLPSAELLAYV